MSEYSVTSYCQKQLNGKEISSIVRACASVGVKTLTYGDLHISFVSEASTKAIVEEIPQENISHQYQIGDQPEPQTTPEPEDIDALLAIENPYEWERRLLEGE